jgi:hypothetical protein
MSRRTFMSFVASAVLTPPGRATATASTELPIDLQAQLTSKAAAYDRNLRARAGSLVLILLVYVPSEPESVQARNQLESAFLREGEIAGLPLQVSSLALRSASDVVEAVRKNRVSILCLTSAANEQAMAIAKALSGCDVLSMSVVPAHVKYGVVLGFRAVSAKPRMMVNLAQAQQQNVSFRPDFLKLAEVLR